MADDYRQLIENIFDSIDTIAEARVKDLQFNKTVRCEIVDTTKKDKGEYTVTDGATKFKAYSDNTHYNRGDYVNVTIPNGDYSAQKMITGRCMTSEEDVFNYVSPLKSYIDITQNLIEDGIESAGLVANGQKSYVTLWEKKDFGGMKAYQRLGLKADFKVWLSNLKPVEGNYGLRLTVIGRTMNTTQTASQLKTYTFTLDSNDMYGDPYNFDNFFTQEKVFDISEIPQIESIKLEFYQKRNFKNKQKKYIAHEDTTGYSLGANLFVQNPYISLGYATENYSTDTVLIYALEEDTYANYLTESVKEEELKKTEELSQKLEDLQAKQERLDEVYQELLTDLNNTYGDKTSSEYKNKLWKLEEEYKEKQDLYQHQYEMLKNEIDLNNPEKLQEIIAEKNLKNIYLRWIHQDETAGRMVGIQSQDGMPEGAKIHWYRYILEEGLTDPLAGPFWKEIDTSEWESPFLYKAFQPDEKLSTEQIRVIIEYKSRDYVNHVLIPNDEQIIKLDEEINKGTATDEQIADRESIANAYLEEVHYYMSDILTFKNESEVASGATLSLIKDLVIKCDEAGGKGVYNLYNSAGALLSQMEAQKKRILSASYNTLVTGDNTIDLPETVTWRIPLVNTMIYPPTEGVEYSTYSQVSLTKTEDFVIGTHYKLTADNKYVLLQPNDKYADTDKYFIKNAITTKVADDGSYIDITRYGAVTSRIAGTEEADSMEQYFRIKPQYSQNLTNNTVYCIVNKNNKNFEASYTMHFGTIGTNGTDYTFTLEIDNAVPAMTWDSKTGITVKPKILNHIGKDITDEFSASNFTYSWYSPTQTGDVGLTREKDGKNCKIGFKDTTTEIKQTYHHILQCKTTVDITYSTNTMTTSINTSNNNTVEKVTPKTTTKPITLTAYLAIPIRRTEYWTGFAGADKICYSNVGTNPEYYRNQYDLYYYDKNDKKTKVQPNYQKVTTNKQEDFDKGIYYEQSFEFTQVEINSQAELKPGVHYKLQNGFQKVVDNTPFDGNERYYAKTKDNKYIEIDIDSNTELHKGQYYIRKDEYVAASEEEIENNAYATNYFYVKNSDGSYSVIDTIIEHIGNYDYIKGRYYTLESQEYVLITGNEEYDQNTQYYINNYKYVPVTTPNETDYNNGLYYLADLGYVLQYGNIASYDSTKEYFALGADDTYYAIDSAVLSETIFKQGDYYLYENEKYSPLKDIYYFNANDQFFIKNNESYYQVSINGLEDLRSTTYYIKDHGYNRLALNDIYNNHLDYYVFGMDGTYHKVAKTMAVNLVPQGRYYYEKTDYITVHSTETYDNNKNYFITDNGEYINIYFANEEEYLEYLQLGNSLYYQSIYKQAIYNVDLHNYDSLNKYFVELDYGVFIQIGITSKEELLLSPYFTYGDFYVATNIYDISNTYYLEVLENGLEKYIPVIVASESDMSTRQYYYKTADNSYKPINHIFDKGEKYYIKDKPNNYIQISLLDIDSLEYGNYYAIDNIYYETNPAGDDFIPGRQYYIKQLGEYILKIDLGNGSQSMLDTLLLNNENCFKLQTTYKLLQTKTDYINGQITYYRQRVNGRYDPVTIYNSNELNIISNFYTIKNQYRLITETDVFKNSARYFKYDTATKQYIEITGEIQKTSDFQIGTHYILEDGYFAVKETDTYSSTQIYYIQDVEGDYYETILTSNNELQKGVYYITDNKEVLVTSEDIYDKNTQYYLPGNITYVKAKAYDASKIYYICIAKWKIRLGANTGYNYNKSASEANNAKIAKCYPMMSDDNTIVPLAMYIQETKPEISVICINESNNHVLWVQPIRIYLNAHSSQLLNAWSGELTIDENNGTILSSLVGAGKKDSENRFNGILMGDMTKASDNETATEYYTGTGLYGYNAGIKSFGLNINGRAFFGKAGRGQILIDGNSGTIKSARYAATESKKNWSEKEGILIDLDSGLIKSHATDSSATIFIDPNNGKETNKNTSYHRGYFRINSANNNCLMFVGKEDYYLQTDDYQARELDDSAPKGKTKIKTPGKGLFFNLADGRLIGYNFAITAYADEKAGTYNTADIKYISINSKAKDIPFKVGNKFSVDWNGKITSTGGTIGGWIIEDSRLYKNCGNYTISLRKAVKNDTNVIQVEEKTKKGTQSNFFVKANGQMYARNANIKGKITADEGTIGGWKISDGSISSTKHKSGKKTVLSSDGTITLNGVKVSISSKTVVTGLKFSRGKSSKSITVVTGLTLGPLNGVKDYTKKKLTFYYPRLEVSRATLTVIGYASAKSLTPDGADLYVW